MRILALPRDANPYQEQLYSEIRRLGVPVRYIGELTPSRTLNLLLLPLETLALALAGWRTVHLHWVFGFAPAGAGRVPGLRRAGQAWFRLWLAAARLGGARIVWTAHNVLPHGRVFHDERRARRDLVRASRLVVAHSPATLDALSSLGAVPSRSAVLPLGPIAGASDPGRLRIPGSTPGPRHFLFFGQVHEHKGVEDLLAAVAAVPADRDLRVTVAGRCADPALAARLERLARPLGRRAALRLERVPDDEVEALMAAADVVVLPFRRVTTSSSAALALGLGRPLLVPRLPALDDLPDDAVARYDGSVGGLADALRVLGGAPPARLAAMAAAARAHRPPGWDAIAAGTLAAIRGEDAPGPPPAAEAGTR